MDWKTAPSPIPVARVAALVRVVAIDLSITMGLVAGLMLVASHLG